MARRRGPDGETRRRMIEALRQMLKAKPAGEVRAHEIAAAVGVSQPNFYNHFRNLQEALLACAELSWSSYPQVGPLICDNMGLEGALEVARQLMEFWREHVSTLSWAYTVELGASMSDYVVMREFGQRNFVGACRMQLERSMAAGRLDPRLDAQLAGYLIVSRLDNFGLAENMITRYGGYDRDELTEAAARMLLIDLGLKAR